MENAAGFKVFCGCDHLLVFIHDSSYNHFMLTIEQTVTISPDHRVFFDLPPELPVGRAKVALTFTPLPDTPQTGDRGKIRLTKPMIDEMLNEEALLSLTGFLHTEMSADEIRTERLKEHDHTN